MPPARPDLDAGVHWDEDGTPDLAPHELPSKDPASFARQFSKAGAGKVAIIWDERDPLRTPIQEPEGPDLLRFGPHLRRRITFTWISRKKPRRLVLDRPWGAPIPHWNERSGRCSATVAGRRCKSYVLPRAGFWTPSTKLLCSACGERQWPGVGDALKRRAARRGVYAVKHGKIKRTDPCLCESGVPWELCCGIRGRVRPEDACVCGSERAAKECCARRRIMKTPDGAWIMVGENVVRRPLPSLASYAAQEFGGAGEWREACEAEIAEARVNGATKPRADYCELVARRKKVVGVLETIDNGDPAVESLVAKISACRRVWEKVACADCGDEYLVRPQWTCQRRICPLCNHARMRRARSRVLAVLERRTVQLRARPRLEHWVLASRNVHFIDKATWRHEHIATRKLEELFRSVHGREAFEGGVRFLEPQWNDETKSHHPHSHLLVECNGTVRQADLSDWYWVASEGRGYNVTIQTMRDHVRAMAEVSKGIDDELVERVGVKRTVEVEDQAQRVTNYLTSASKGLDAIELVDPSALVALNNSMKGVRMMELLGSWRALNREIALEEDQDPDADPTECEDRLALGPCRACGVEHPTWIDAGTEALSGRRLAEAMRHYDRRAAAGAAPDRAKARSKPS